MSKHQQIHYILNCYPQVFKLAYTQTHTHNDLAINYPYIKDLN
jgi:hypothetical protein